MRTIPEQAVVDIICERYDQIFSAEKKVADYILQNPETAVNANVSELAEYSCVSDATVIRFCKHIGYDGYYQMKICLSRDLGRKQISDAYFDNIEEDTVVGVFQKLASNLIAIGQNIDQDSFHACVNLIKTCAQAHLVAVGNTSPLTQYMGFRLGRLGIKCTYNMVPECAMNNVNLADKDDILIVVSQSGSSKQVLQAMELAKEKDLKIIAITDHECSPVSNLADYILLSSTGEPSFSYYKSYSHLRETAVIDTLLYFVKSNDKIEANSADMPEIIMAESKL